MYIAYMVHPSRKITRICEQCKKPFITIPSRGAGRFCSWACVEDGYKKSKKHAIKKCKQCGCDYTGQGKSYCSGSCRSIDVAKTRKPRASRSKPIKLTTCRFCRRLFINKWLRAVFCSLQCSGKHFAMTHSTSGEKNPNYKGAEAKHRNNIRLRPEYKEWRKAVLKRDGRECQSCLSRQNLHVHHIDSYAKNPKSRLKVANGITLCENCHGAFHKYDKVNDIEKNESKLKGKSLAWLKTQKDCKFIKFAGSIYQTVGTPDLIGCVAGRSVFIELKMWPNFATIRQKHELRLWKESGAFVFTCRTVSQVKAAIDIVRESIL